MRKTCLFLILVLIVQRGFAQRNNLNDGNVSDFSVVNVSDTAKLTGRAPFFPILTPELPLDESRLKQRSLFHRKLFYEHTITVDTGQFHLTADPLFNFQLGKSMDNVNGNRVENTTYTNTRGFILRAQITNRIGFTTSFLENQSEFPDYLSNLINGTSVVPGQGRAKIFEEGFDYAMASGMFYLKASDNFSLVAGHGKNKVGNGYRSLFLSENSHNYPFLRLNLSLFNNKLEYFYLGAVFQNLYRLPVSVDTESPFLRKTANFHYLSWQVNKRWRLGFMEATLFANMDSTGRTVFYANQVNPLPVINSLSYGLDGKHNSMVGIDWNYLIGKGFSTYGQLLWDNNKYNRNALQLGVKWRKSNKILLLAERNSVANRFYGASDRLTQYNHYNQFLAHPSGSSFDESLFLARIKLHRFYSLLKLNLIEYRKTVIFPSGFSMNPTNSTAAIQEFAVGYFINQRNGMSARFGILNRIQSKINSNETLWIYLGFQTFLPQFFYDF